MTQGPPCPNCGSLLTWYPDQHQWGCDRCRVMYPPQVMVHPQAYARSPERPRPKRAARGLVKSKKPLVYGILAAVLVIGGVGVAFFMIRSGKKTGVAGFADSQTAVTQTFTLLAAGDVDGLVAKSIAKASLVTCDEGSSAGSGSGSGDELRGELQRAADQAKGTAIVVDKVTEPDPPVVKEQGSPGVRNCSFAAQVKMHELHVTLRITQAGKVRDGEAKLALAESGEHFFIAGAPRLGGCEGAVAWTAMVLGRESDPALAQKLSTPLLASCADDKWPAKIIDCTANALGVKDEHSCLKDLDAGVKQKLATALDQAIGVDKSPAAATLRTVIPMAEAPKPVSLGTPEKSLADFWLVPRSDGAYLLTSPLVTAVFPAKPQVEIKRSTKPNGDGKLFDIYTFSVAASGAEPLYELHVIAMGHNMKDPNGFATVEAELAKLGKVVKAERTEEGQQVTRLTVANTYVLDGRIDLPHGLIMTASASGAQTPGVTAYLASVHLLSPPDPADAADTLTGVRQRKGDKTKLVVHDSGDHFIFEIPFNADIKRKVEDKTVTVAIGKKGKPPVVTISELAPWDALVITPSNLAAAQAKLKGKARLVWNESQRRMFKVACGGDAPCDPIVKSFHFSDPEPPTLK